MYETGPALLMTRPGRTEMRVIRYPEFSPETVVVRTVMSGISGGTDTNLFRGRLNTVWYPLVPGYENVGEVVAVREQAAGQFQPGDRVMANEIYQFPDVCGAWGGQVAFSVRNPEATFGRNAVKIPDAVSYEEAVVAYLASVALKGVDRSGATQGQTALVTGMGVIGLSAVQIFSARGLRVIALDRLASRLQAARRFTDEVIDASQEDSVERVKAMTGGAMVDLVYEASGSPTLAAEAVCYLRWGHGHVHFQGHYTSPVILSNWHEWFGDHTMSATCANTEEGKRQILGMIAEGRFDAKSLYTEVRPIQDAQKAYEDVAEQPCDYLKILFDWRSL
jgi:2-desacetyl-2-hydroxyethyl bacteriochlorophyllide A dehydrogenase